MGICDCRVGCLREGGGRSYFSMLGFRVVLSTASPYPTTQIKTTAATCDKTNSPLLVTVSGKWRKTCISDGSREHDLQLANAPHTLPHATRVERAWYGRCAVRSANIRNLGQSSNSGKDVTRRNLAQTGHVVPISKASSSKPKARYSAAFDSTPLPLQFTFLE